MTAHANCTHEATKAARTECRKARAEAAAAQLARDNAAAFRRRAKEGQAAADEADRS